MAGSNLIKPLKIETTAGGDALDLLPAESDPSEDFLKAKGVDLGSTDDIVVIEENNGVMELKDSECGPISLCAIVEQNPDAFRGLVHTKAIIVNGEVILMAIDRIVDSGYDFLGYEVN